VIVALAALMTACAAFAPLYFRAMQQSLTDVLLDRSSSLETGVQLWSTPAEFRPAAVRTPEEVANEVSRRMRDNFGAPTLGYDASAAVIPGGAEDPAGPLIWRSGQCQQLTMTAGRCPAAAGEVAVSEADLMNFDLRLGDRILVAGRPEPTRDGSRAPDQPLELVGAYEQHTDDYWFERPLTGSSGLVDPNPPNHLMHDVWITPRQTFEAEGWDVAVRSAYAGFRIDPRLGVDALLELDREVDDLGHKAQPDGTQPLNVVSGLPELVSGAQEQIDQSRVTVPLLMAQLCLLAIVVLWLVLLAITEQRLGLADKLARVIGATRRG
jgi:hypothetical protein